MAEISNKTLAVFLAAAIVISLGGALLTVLQVSNLANMIPALQGITGFGTTGRVNVTVAVVAQLNVAPANVEFGVGYVAAGYTIAELNSSQAVPANWTSQSDWSAKDIGIANTGTVDINVNFTSDSTGTTMLGGTGSYAQYDAYNNETSSCSAAASGVCGGALANLTAIESTAAPGYEVCKNLSYVSGKRSLNISVVLGVPQDSASGNKTALWTFTATRRNAACS
ncbi:MAG: hypothetical protein V1886_01745 [archaeon]